MIKKTRKNNRHFEKSAVVARGILNFVFHKQFANR
jgi:hypothetical protein